MHLMYFTEQPMSAYPEDEGPQVRRHRAHVLQPALRSGRPAAGSTTSTSSTTGWPRNVGFDGIMLNEHHNAPFCMQAKCNVFASILAAMTKRVKIVLLGNPAAARRQPGAAGRGAGDDRHGLARAPRVRLRARRRPGAARHRRQPGLQPRALRGGARPDRQGVDPARAVPLGGHALPAPRGEPVGGAAAEAAPARVDSGRAQQGDDHLGGEEALPVHRAQHRDRGDQEDLGAVRSGGARRPATPAAPSTAATSSAATSPRPRRRRWRTRASSCGCRASSPASRIRCGRARPATSRRRYRTRLRRVRGRAPLESARRGLRGPDQQTSRSSPARRRPSSRSSAACSRRRGRPSSASGRADGFVSSADTRTCIRLLGEEVLPAVREIGKELGLWSPFEANAPVSIAFPDPATPARERVHDSSHDIPGGFLMPVRSCLGALLLVFVVVSAAPPARAATEPGTMVWGLHVTLVSRWLDPGETEALITPFMVLYALHDALVKPMPGGHQHAEPRRVVDRVEGRAHLRVRPAQERASSTTAIR